MRLSLIPALALCISAAGQQPAHSTHRPATSRPDAPTAAVLPVTSVSLYKNGVGYFEHTGHVTGSGAVTIDFTSSQLNDVLQSLTAIDLNGGRITGADYNSTTPLEQQLKTLPFTLGEDSNASDFYAAIRGARVTVSGPGGGITGRLLSIEQRSTSTGNDDSKPSIPHNFITVVSDAGEVRTVELSGATTVRLLDPTLQRSVDRYLQLVESNRSQGLRHLTLQDTGSGTREIRVSYISEVPVWKSTYRILVGPAATPAAVTPGAATSTTATLQGWSVVDNTTGADWIDVHLSLIAGAPQSFIQPLSQPIYSRRPEIPIATEAQLTPQTFDSSIENAPAPPPPVPGLASEAVTVEAAPMAQAKMARNYAMAAATGSGNGVGSGFSAGSAGNTGGGAMHINGALYNELAAASLNPNASASAFDDFFSYTLDTPVTILKNQSALVPILQTKVPSESVTLLSYANGVLSQPLRALWLTNASNLTLDRGSFTVIEAGNFAGEGLLDPVHPGEKRLVSYAADQALHAKLDGSGTAGQVTLVRAARGVLTVQTNESHQISVALHNAAPETRTVITEVPVVSGWTLDADTRPQSSDPKPVETTPTVYRYRTVLGPGITQQLHVGASHTGSTTYYLTNTTDEQLRFLLQQTGNNQQLTTALAPLLDARRKVADAQAAVDQTNARLTALHSDEDRQRANITALANADHAARERFVTDLNKTEDAINAAQAELTQRQQALDQAKADLAAKIEGFSIDEKIN